MSHDAPIRPLVVPTIPHADESLAGLVARATKSNVLGASRIILEEVGLSLPRPGSIGRDLGGRGQRLAEKIGCTAAEIARLAHPYVGEVGRSAAVHWGGTQLLRSDLSLNRRRISPATLVDQDYHSASWMLSLLHFCPKSFERLIDRCTACGEALGWVAARGIGDCEHCRNRVHHPDGETLPDALRSGYAKFADLVSMRPETRLVALSKLAPELRALPTSSLVGLVTSLGRALVHGAAEVRRDRFQSAPPLLTAQTISLGTTMLDEWPCGLRTHLSESYTSDGKAEQSVIRNLQQRCRDRGMEVDAAEVVRRALPELFNFGRKSLGSLTVPMMDPSEFRQRTGFSNFQWKTLHSSGALGTPKATGHRRASVRVPRAAAEQLIAIKQASQPSAALEQTLGLPAYAIEQLACAGEIEHADHPGFRVIGLENRITVKSAEALIEDLKRPSTLAQPRDAVPLLRLVAMFCGGEKPWGRIVSDLRTGAACHWLLPEREDGALWRRPLVRRILVMPDHFARHAPVKFDRSAHPDFPFETTMSQQDAIEVLGTTVPQLRDALETGEVAFEGRSGKSVVTDRLRISELANVYVGTSELGFKLGLSRNHLVVRLMKDKHPHLHRHALGWLRHDLAGHWPHLFGPTNPIRFA